MLQILGSTLVEKRFARERGGKRKDDIGESPALQQKASSGEEASTRRRRGWELAW
jgi:hypothetical protein